MHVHYASQTQSNMPVVTRSQKKLSVPPSTHMETNSIDKQFTKKELARIQSVANRIINMPMGLPDKYNNMSNADVLKHAIINNKNGTATTAEQKLTKLYDETCSKTLKATYIEKLESLTPEPNVQMEVKELNPVSHEPVVSHEPDNTPWKPIDNGNNCEEIRPGIYRTVLSNGTVYEGEMMNGMFHGHGKFTYPITDSDEVRNPTYTGYFSNNLEHGNGRYDWGLADVYYYNGNFVNGYFHGNGMLVRGNIIKAGNFVCGEFA